MTKPKPEWKGTKEQWYEAGLADGEKRLERELIVWLDNEWLERSSIQILRIKDWLTARAKRGK